MRVLACLAAAGLLLVPSAAGATHGPRLLVRDGRWLTLVGRETVAAGPYKPLAFSGDGRLYSYGGAIHGGIPVTLPTHSLTWAPTGERAAYVTTQGGVVEWTPAGKKRLEPNGWGADWGLAWSREGALAVSRGSELWVLENGTARRVAGPLPSSCCTGGAGDIPVPFAWVGDRVLWWRWPDSGSIAADGVTLWEDDRQLGTTLMYRDYTAVCGSHVAFSEGRDRYSTHGKSLVFDERDVSKDTTRSWTEPACLPDGRLVAAAGRNGVPRSTFETHRSLWQLQPTRRQLTRPPWGWSDEDPHLLPDGSLVFVRARITSKRKGDTWLDTEKGRVMLLAQGKLTEVASVGYANRDESKGLFLGPYYGHYDWSDFLAVAP